MKFQFGRESDFIYIVIVNGPKIGFSVLTKTELYTSAYVKLNTNLDENALYEKLRYYRYNEGFIPTKVVDGDSTMYVSELNASSKTCFRESITVKSVLMRDAYQSCKYILSILYELREYGLSLQKDVRQLKAELIKRPLPVYLHNPLIKFGTEFRYKLLKGEYDEIVKIFKCIDCIYAQKLKYSIMNKLIYQCDRCHRICKVYKCSYCVKRVKDVDDEIEDE